MLDKKRIHLLFFFFLYYNRLREPVDDALVSEQYRKMPERTDEMRSSGWIKLFSATRPNRKNSRNVKVLSHVRCAHRALNKHKKRERDSKTTNSQAKFQSYFGWCVCVCSFFSSKSFSFFAPSNRLLLISLRTLVFFSFHFSWNANIVMIFDFSTRTKKNNVYCVHARTFDEIQLNNRNDCFDYKQNINFLDKSKKFSFFLLSILFFVHSIEM